jgi:hypothetical protein
MATLHGAFLVLVSQQTTRSAGGGDAYLGQWARDGVAAGLADGSMLGSSEAGDKRDDGDLGEHGG